MLWWWLSVDTLREYIRRQLCTYICFLTMALAVQPTALSKFTCAGGAYQFSKVRFLGRRSELVTQYRTNTDEGFNAHANKSRHMRQGDLPTRAIAANSTERVGSIEGQSFRPAMLITKIHTSLVQGSFGGGCNSKSQSRSYAWRQPEGDAIVRRSYGRRRWRIAFSEHILTHCHLQCGTSNNR